MSQLADTDGQDLLPVPAIEVGGSHVSTALVDVHGRKVLGDTLRSRVLQPNGTASEILDAITGCAADTLAAGSGARDSMGVAIPGPFDYATGIGRFKGKGVAKFETLDGVDVGAALIEGLAGRVSWIRFLNDADALAIGEWTAGAARGHDRAVAITIGTGIGSTFMEHGRVIEDGPQVPPTGRAYLLVIDGEPLEDRVSRRAILRAAADHPVLASNPSADVRELADAARAGDAAAAGIFDDALTALGRAMGPWLTRFESTVLVVGGAIAASWGLVEPPLRVGLAVGDLGWDGPVRPASLGADAGLIGAAMAAANLADGPPGERR